MPLDMSDPRGFNAFWEDTVDQFRLEAIDQHLDTGNLSAVNVHETGPVDQNALQSQYAFPVIWSVPTNHSPAYATTNTDHGDLGMRVVVFASDVDAQTAFDKARTLGGRVVNNVEGSALVDQNGDAHAANVLLDDFQTDSRPVNNQGNAQLKFAELAFSINVERPY
jgi:hypothetical protein